MLVYVSLMLKSMKKTMPTLLIIILIRLAVWKVLLSTIDLVIILFWHKNCKSIWLLCNFITSLAFYNVFSVNGSCYFYSGSKFEQYFDDRCLVLQLKLLILHSLNFLECLYFFIFSIFVSFTTLSCSLPFSKFFIIFFKESMVTYFELKLASFVICQPR